ncbi:MAG: hypothetical protein FXF47_07255 [Candidatus Mcinerneyibacterium aminivorans]|uniref:Gliding motility protein SprA N-terminal domain-containing protein n=1 Tax=Candidatus Mcinerneyibacterium aminivorans TaxID=2703815 RepID=A0A5D0MAU8_9BACT|nr:MAG: hypothetical protein FXF47_07255 [Candidatus Mcinerneyibacterium aminivorans]
MHKKKFLLMILCLVLMGKIFGDFKTDFFLKKEMEELKKIPEFYYGIDLPPIEENLEFEKDLWYRINRSRFSDRTTQSGSGFIPDIQLGEDSKIKISGRKTVDLKIRNKLYTEVDEEDIQTASTLPQSQTDFLIDQQMQLQVEGQIKDRIFIDVEYDNTQDWDTKKNIKLQYLGTEDEILREVTLGEISLSLPQTRFISFHKTLFGARANVQVGPVSYSGIISKKEGEAKSSSFTGSSKMTTNMIENENYSRKFYNLKKVLPEAQFPLQELKIYYDDNQKYNDDKSSIEEYEVTIDGETRTFHVSQLLYPDDYKIRDEESSLIEFKNEYSSGYLLISYKDAQGNTHNFDNFNEEQLIYSEEKQFSEARMKNKYYLGQEGIAPQETVVNIYDTADNDKVLVDGNDYYYLHLFGIDMDNDGTIDNRFIDYDEGYLNFEVQKNGEWVPNDRPFDFSKYLDESGNIKIEELPDYLMEIRNQIGDIAFKEQIINKLDNIDIYEDFTDPDSRYNIYVRYFSPTQTFSLNQVDIIPDSETVMVDGEKMVRGKDYSIDYMTGRIHFLNQDLIGPNSSININYEYRPLFAGKAKTLFGNRIEFEKSDNFKVGATYIRDWMPEDELDRAPQFGDETKSHSVYGTNLDYQYEKGDFKAKVEGEIAKSKINPNTYGEVFVDNMENSRMEKEIGLLQESWNIASSPEGFTDSSRYVGRLDPYSFFDLNRIDLKDIDPEIYSDEEKRIMHIEQLPDNSDEFFSYVQKLSNRGSDLTNYKKIVVWYKLQQGAPTLHFDLGIISEDSDGDGILDTEDKNDNTILENGEDVGFDFNINGNVYKIGANNNRLDEEDLDANGVLRTRNDIVSYDLNLTGDGNWHKATINLEDYSAGDIDALNLVKHLRFWGEGFSGGELQIAKISVVGTMWEIKKVEPETNKFEVSTVSNYTDPEYEPLHSDKIEGTDTRREDVSLVLDFDMQDFIDGENYGYCEKDYGTRRDFTEYKNVKVAYFPTSDIQGEFEFFVRFATNEENYYEITKTVNESTPNQWNYINLGNLEEIDLNENVTKVGDDVNIKNIKYMYFGIKNSGSEQPYSGKLYVNDIKLVDPKIQEGSAKYFALDMNYSNYLSLNYDIESQDGKYAMIDKDPSYEDKLRQTFRSSLNLGKLLFQKQNINMNTSFSYSDSKTENNKFIGTGVDIDRLGKREYKRYRVTTNISKNKWPSLNYNFNYNRNDSSMSSDPYYKEELSHSSSLNYSFFEYDIFGFSVVPENLNFSVSEDLNRKFYTSPENEVNNTSSRTNRWSLALKWEFIKNLNTNWNYDLTENWDLMEGNFEKQTKSFYIRNNYSKNFSRIVSLNLNYSTNLDDRWNYDDVKDKSQYYLYDYDINRTYSSRVSFRLIKYFKNLVVFRKDFNIDLNYSNNASRSYDLTSTRYDWTFVMGDMSGLEKYVQPDSDRETHNYGLEYETNFFDILDFDLSYEHSIEDRSYKSTNSSHSERSTWPEIDMRIGDFEKIPVFNLFTKFVRDQNMTFSYEKTETTTKSSGTVRKSVQKEPSFDWDIKWDNHIETDMSIDYNQEISKVGDNPEAQTNNLRGSFKFSHFIRSSKIIGVLLSKRKKRQTTYLKLNYSFNYDEKWFKNQNKANNYTLTNKIEGKYSLSNQMNINMEFEYNMFRSEESIKNYNEFVIGVGFEILF